MAPDLAQVRILRLAAGTASSLWCSQAVGWDISFIAPVITMFILALPFPAPKLKMGIGFVAMFALALYGGLLLLPALLGYPLVGVLLLVLALFWSFYFTASGGSQVIGSLSTLGIALSTAVGSVNIDAALMVSSGLLMNVTIGVVFVWIAHAFIPDSSATTGAESPGAKPPPRPKPDLHEARWSAFRSLLIIFPIAMWFMLSSASTSYIPVMIKVASMGQQATNDAAKQAGRSLLMSTIIGGTGAIVGWNLLKLVPTLTMYTLIIAVAALIVGPKIFRGQTMRADAGTWSYGYLTMIVILGPAVMDSMGSSNAGAAFWSRLLMFALATLYGIAAIYLVDAFRPVRKNVIKQLNSNVS